MKNFKKEKLSFSKKLVVYFSFGFAAMMIFSALTWFFQSRVPVELLTFFGTPYVAILTGYTIKAGYENRYKISGSNTMDSYNYNYSYNPDELEANNNQMYGNGM